MTRLVIDLETVPEEGKRFAGELPAAIFELPEGDAKPLGPLRFDLHAQRFGGELLVRGRLRAPFEFQCVRTLRLFQKTIDLPGTAISLEIEKEGEIDLTASLREEILLNFPAYPRCDEGDDPLPCEIDPRYLAVDNPGEGDVEIPPPSESDRRWAALDALDTFENPEQSS